MKLSQILFSWRIPVQDTPTSPLASFLLRGAMAISALLLIPQAAHAQVAYDLIQPKESPVHIEAVDTNREEDTLVLYTPNFGTFTRTNGFGVEVIAEKKGPGSTLDTTTYKVKSVTDVWTCTKKKKPEQCGNAPIPQNGIVLSAAGNQREWLLKHLKPGKTFELQSLWFTQASFPLNAIDPTPENNKWGQGYPGMRGAHQMLVYTPAYGTSNTGTNEFGFEVSVVNGTVVARDGADSAIPPGGMVISGHGRARDWLIAHAPFGAHIDISPDGKTLRSRIDIETYRYQLNQRIGRMACSAISTECSTFQAMDTEAMRLYGLGQGPAAAALLSKAIRQADEKLWNHYVTFPGTAIRGIWHRPVELSNKQIAETLDRFKASGVNTVFLETFYHGYTIFPSQTYVKYGMGKSQKPEFQNLDHLLAWTTEAHKRKMQVHVWIETFYGGARNINAPGPILKARPTWANVQFTAVGKTEPTPATTDNGGYFLDPANPEVRQFVLDMLDEIVTRYPVDGVQLDYIRYPATLPSNRDKYKETTWGYTSYARQAFQSQYGVDPATLDPKRPETAELWSAWSFFKKQQIDTMVQTAATQLKAKRPQLIISVDIFPDLQESLMKKHQDWAEWAAEGWVDYIVPLTLTGAVSSVQKDVQNVMAMTNGKVDILASVFAPFNNLPPERMLEQIEAARKYGATGFAIFDSAHLSNTMGKALSASTPAKR